MGLLISDMLVSAFENQIGHEIKNAHIYLYISAVLNGKGLDKLALGFERQYGEELEHAKSLHSFLVDLNVVPKMVEIDETDSESLAMSDQIESIAKKYMEREISTTDNLGDLLTLSIEENNYVATEFLRTMIQKQQAEYAEATDFSDKAELCSNNWVNVLIWNNSLG